ncbi:MAG: VOC family protein [Alphaproteobacteria bacterium]|nr:VOC family protein [Alphaproteobacteria bacterium]
MKVQPYINFNGRCDEALDFYKTAIGAEVQMLMRFSDAPPQDGMPMPDPALADKVMHSSFTVGETTVMATDGECRAGTGFVGISLTLDVPDVDEARTLFDALSQGGRPATPFGPTFFARGFGMVADKFGVSWMVIAPAEMG